MIDSNHAQVPKFLTTANTYVSEYEPVALLFCEKVVYTLRMNSVGSPEFGKLVGQMQARGGVPPLDGDW